MMRGGLPLVCAVVLVLGVPHAVSPATVEAVSTVTGAVQTAHMVTTAGVRRLAVNALVAGSTGPMDANSRGTAGASTAVVVGAGATVTVFAALATPTRRKVAVQNPGGSAGVIRVGRTGVGAGVGLELYPTQVWEDTASASAAVVVSNPLAVAVTVQLESESD